MRFLVRDGRVIIYGFVIMSNHMHIIWQMVGKHEPGSVQRDFLKFTGQMILKQMRNEHSKFLGRVKVDEKDRVRQIWNKASLRRPLTGSRMFDQKLDYIHWNPVKAGMVSAPEDYRYSSASYYYNNDDSWDFLTPAGG